jgi:hypothetical protein
LQRWGKRKIPNNFGNGRGWGIGGMRHADIVITKFN